MFIMRPDHALLTSRATRRTVATFAGWSRMGEPSVDGSVRSFV